MVNNYDVIIIGAGLSGVYCASLLKKYGLKIAVLESSPRIGGRLKSIRDDKGGYELGGTYIGNSYQRVINVANRIGLELIDVSNLLSFFKQQDLVIDGEIIAQKEWPSHKKNILDSKLKHIMPWNLHRTLLKKHNPFNTTEACLGDMSFKDCSMGDWLRSLNFNEKEIRIIYGMNVS